MLRLRTLAFVLWLCSSIIFATSITGSRIVYGIRVQFEQDSSMSTTGDGTFLIHSDFDTCSNYTLDPPPHGRHYFLSQFQALDHYFRNVSYNQFGLDLDQSQVFPLANDSAYSLPNPMAYYHPYNQSDVQDDRLVELLRDAVVAAYNKDQINFSDADIIVVFHAGIGQDFSLPYLDPTPEDIPSTFVDPEMIQNTLGTSGITVGNSTITQGILLPETQNHLLYSESNPLLDTDQPCDYQFALTGTFALMTGFAVGLPPLWDIDTGESGAGVFTLMDQGSNNGRGLMPSPPDAWTRLYAGWESPIDGQAPLDVQLPSRSQGNLVKVPLTSTEYYLIEARNNFYRGQVSLDSIRYLMYVENDIYPPLVNIILDSIPHTTDPETGVVTGFDDYDLGQPGTGLLIWHIDENRIAQGIDHFAINGDREARGVDLEEADGAQDIGYPNIFISADPTSGYFGDFWFKGNHEYERSNRGMGGHYPQFGPTTFPDTRLNSGVDSYVVIDSIGPPADTMSFIIRNARKISRLSNLGESLRLLYDFDGDGSAEVLGGDGRLWSLGSDDQKNVFIDQISNPYRLVLVDSTKLGVVEANQDSFKVIVYSYDTSNKSFFPDWTKSFLRNEGPYYIYSNPNSSHIFVETRHQIINVDSAGVDSANLEWSHGDSVLTVWNNPPEGMGIAVTPTTYRIKPEGGFQVGESPYEIDYYPERRFSHIIGTHLDRNGLAQIVLTGDDGKLYVFNILTTLRQGYPVQAGTVRTLLSADVLSDSGIEIVTQDTTGLIKVWTSLGKLALTIGTDPADSLLQLANWDGNSVAVCQHSVWSLSETMVGSDDWTFPDHYFWHSRSVDYDYYQAPDTLIGLWAKKGTYVYPNPAKDGKVTFRFTVNHADKVEIVVYSIAGYFVKRWVSDHPAPFLPNEIEWNVSNVEPGVYFARLTAEYGSKKESKVLKLGILN